jgi:hypothetical protein
MHATTTVQPGYCTIRLFAVAWLKVQLKRRQNDDSDELYEVVDEILAGRSIEMIETVFGDWMDRPERVTHENNEYIS